MAPYSHTAALNAIVAANPASSHDQQWRAARLLRAIMRAGIELGLPVAPHEWADDPVRFALAAVNEPSPASPRLIDDAFPVRVAQLLNGALAAKRCHITPIDHGRPLTERHNDHQAAGGPCIGWRNGNVLWLIPSVVTTVLKAETWSTSHRVLNATQQRIGRALVDAGLATTERSTDGTRRCVRRWIGATRQRVWELPSVWLSG